MSDSGFKKGFLLGDKASKRKPRQRRKQSSPAPTETAPAATPPPVTSPAPATVRSPIQLAAEAALEAAAEQKRVPVPVERPKSTAAKLLGYSVILGAALAKVVGSVIIPSS